MRTTEDTPGLGLVGLRLLQFGWQLGCATGRFAGRLLASRLRKTPYAWQTLLGQSLAEMCASLGATYIKVGQILSTRRDLLPPEVIAPLVRLQDSLPPFDSRRVPGIIEAELGRPLAEIFTDFDPEPISSASVASVYRARLRTGQAVAVKIRRPGIIQHVAADLRIMRACTRLLGRLPPLRLIPLLEGLDEISRPLEEQLDFRREAAHNRRFRRAFANDPHIRIPQLVEQYCSEAVLTMEFVEGLVRVDALPCDDGAYQPALVTALRALYHMIFVDGLVHCDLHPGNLYLCKDGKAVILDTGFVAALSQDDQDQFVEFFYGIATNAGKDCARIVYETASYKAPTLDRAAFDQAIITLIDRSWGAKASAFQVANFVFQLFDIQRRYGLRGSPNFTLPILSLLVFEGIAKQLYPELDFQSEARPFLIPTLLQKMLRDTHI